MIKPSDTFSAHNLAVGAHESNTGYWTESSVGTASYGTLDSKFPYHGDYGAATPQPINLYSYAAATETSGKYIRRRIKFGR
jgi:hypothetical protein